jgi:hypothetical protein
VPVSVKGIDVVIAQLSDVQSRSRDLTPVLELIAADTVTVIDDAFETSTSPAGVAWAPLKPSTIAKRRKGRGGASDKILVDTSVLRSSINARPQNNGLRFGASAGYGKYHLATRSFLPIEGERGVYQLGTTGPAATHWSRARESIKRYVVTGEVR